MKIADVLHKLADLANSIDDSADQSQSEVAVIAPIEQSTEIIDVEGQSSPNGTTPSGNDKGPEDVFLPPLQQKQELLKKAVGVENVYDDGGPAEQNESEETHEDDMSAERDNIVNRIKQLSGIPVAAIQELSNDDIVDD